MDKRRVIGIDFGSSQSSIAVMKIGSTDLPELLNVSGGRDGVTIPTLLALDSNDDSLRAYGNEVPEFHKNTNNGAIKFASNFKRYLGRTPSVNADDNEKNANTYCKIFLKGLADFVKKRFFVDKLDSESFVTCIAHPATWSQGQVDLLKKYAAEAGFPVDPIKGIYTIEEPVAAMHALTVQQSQKFHFGNCPEHYMVIDFGGGTLDICVIETDILGKAPKIISTSGDPTLGGWDFDKIIEHLFFRNNESIQKKNLTAHEIVELDRQIKQAKEGISLNFWNSDTATQPIHLASGQYSLTTTKQEISSICRDRGYFDKIKATIHDALDKANIDVPSIKKVILTGGSSKWFFLREIVAKEFALGGEAIYNTEHPFTDVANGCAISIGRPAGPTAKPGIWICYRINEKEKWSDPKCILQPGRIVSKEESCIFIGTIAGTQYLTPYKIMLSWWTGHEKDDLKQIGKDAVIEFYARSNAPFLDRFHRMIQVFKDEDTKKQPDEYKIYMKYTEDDTESKKYTFEIMDAAAALKEQVRLTQGENAAKNLPDGYKEKDDILPGYISSRSICGLKVRKLAPIVKGE